MNIDTMHTNFKLEVDKTSSLELPAFEPEEIDYWLNKAILKFVKTRYTGSLTGKGFEYNTKRIEDLRNLIKDVVISGAAITDNTPIFNVDISTVTDFLYTLGENVDIQYTKLGETSYSTKKQGITQCTVDTLRSKLNDPFSEHHLHYEEAKPLRIFLDDEVEFTTDGNYSITKYYLRYLKIPAVVDKASPVNCDLSANVHGEIVNMAVDMALENIEQPRYQSHVAETMTLE